MLEIILPAWIAGIFLTLLTGPLGSFIVWRKMSYFGDTLAHASLLGLAFGLFFTIDPFYAVLVTTIIIGLLLHQLQRNPNLSIDTLLGIFAHSALSLGLVLVSLIPNMRIDLMNYLFGDLLAVTFDDLLILGVAVNLGLLILLWQWNALVAITLDKNIAFVEGYRTERAQLILIILTALVIGLAMKFVGALIITSLLIIPAATARRFAKTPEAMAFTAVCVGMISVTGGLILSAYLNTPAGPSVVVCASSCFVLSLCKRNV